MSKYQQFVFENYVFDEKTKTLSLHYSLDDDMKFTEKFRFRFDFVDNYDLGAVLRACELLFLVAGVSYYKAYLPPEIVVKKAQVDKTVKEFLDNTYQRGLGEFFYVNNLDPNTSVNFPITSDDIAPISVNTTQGKLVGIGGGKDSLVTVELLRNQPKVATWSLNHKPQLEPLINKIGLNHFYVEREFDEKLLELNKLGALNGHIPISSIIACVGTVVSLLTGYSENIVSNESSASEPNLSYRGVDINHQYSKSLDFEKSFQLVVDHLFSNSVSYYSFLRPLSELYITEIFSKIGFEKYHGEFSSCNRAFTQKSSGIFWCGECPKCAFIYLAFLPFVSQEKLEAVVGNSVINDPGLQKTYRQLLGIEGAKPLDCVGDVKECRSAVRLAQSKYPDLFKSFDFEIADDYDYKNFGEHSMPAEVFKLLQSSVQRG